jgi:hypothetical protein
MRKQYLSLALAAATLTALAASPALAQTRTWVSGTGNDDNPCSRAAPCKTFTGALAKTQAGGEISVLDPAGYGAVSINKSISIVADGQEGGILLSFVNAIVVAAGPNDVVSLRGLQIEGAVSGLNGVRFLSGRALNVEKCVIRGFNSTSANAGHGILFQPSGASELHVVDSVIEKNGGAMTGGGILVKPTGTGSAKISLSNVTLNDNTFGFKADGTAATGAAGIQGGIYDSTASGNSTTGFSAVTAVGFQGVNLMLNHSAAFANTSVAAQSSGPGSTVRISDFMAAANGTGLQTTGGGTIISHENNSVSGNGVDGAPTLQVGQI